MIKSRWHASRGCFDTRPYENFQEFWRQKVVKILTGIFRTNHFDVKISLEYILLKQTRVFHLFKMI
jgi:hypothetical protein